VATTLYTALAPLTVYSVIATWYAAVGDNLPLDPARQSTINLLAAGLIAPAPDGAADTTTPAGTLRGQPGAHTCVSN
jgi:hypothetical protein